MRAVQEISAGKFHGLLADAAALGQSCATRIRRLPAGGLYITLAVGVGAPPPRSGTAINAHRAREIEQCMMVLPLATSGGSESHTVIQFQ